MSLTKVSYSMIDGETVNVLDYGADPTGATDSTAAFQAAISTNKIITVPYGTYRVDSPITLDASPSHLSLIGQTSKHTNVNGDGRVVIDLSNNTSHFISMGYAPRIDNIQFKNGVDVFHYTTENGDCSICELNHVRAFGFTGTFFKCYGYGNGTHVTWNNPVLLSNNTTAVVWDDATNFPTQGLDNLTINDGWIETKSTVGFKMSVGRFSVYGTRFVPYTNAGSVWIDHYGAGIVEAIATDFGGESGRTIIKWRNKGGDIYLKNCGLFGFPSGIAINLFAAPDAIAIESCIADSNPSSIVSVSGTIDAENYAYLLNVTNFKVDNQNINVISNLNSVGDAAAAALVSKDFPAAIASSVDVSNCISGLGFTWATSSYSVNTTNVTATSAPDIYGANTYGIKYTASLTDTGSGYMYMNNSPGLSSLTSGWYTLEAVVTVNANGAKFSLLFCDDGSGLRPASKTFWLTEGTHKVCFPCFYSTGLTKNAGYDFSVHAGGSITVNRMKVFIGAYNSRNFSMYGTAAPSGGTVIWERGDRVINSVPTVGQPKSWICTVAGAPGTWVSEGNL